jgi:hypothetical protein
MRGGDMGDEGGFLFPPEGKYMMDSIVHGSELINLYNQWRNNQLAEDIEVLTIPADYGLRRVKVAKLISDYETKFDFVEVYHYRYDGKKILMGYSPEMRMFVINQEHPKEIA